MRLIDAVFRQGHLSEQALADALMTGGRPAHLDRCDLCAERALDMGRWLTAVKTTAVEAADEAFPAERLAAQQAQILRRLEQIDEPARVIAFPRQYQLTPRDAGRRRVAPAWVAVAAAAGLIIGVIGGQLSVRATLPSAPTTNVELSAPDPDAPSFLEMDLDTTPEPLQLIDDITPRLAALAVSGG